MSNRVEIKIAGETYNVICDDEEHTKKVAELVNHQVMVARRFPSATNSQTIVMAACNIADDYIKLDESSENLRAQMKAYIKEVSELRNELNDAKKQLAKFKQARK